MSNASNPAGPLSARNVTLTWLALVVLTVGGWLFARHHTDGSSTIAVSVVAAVKAYLIFAVFMGLWRSPRAWHTAAILWTVATFALIAAVFLRSAT